MSTSENEQQLSKNRKRYRFRFRIVGFVILLGFILIAAAYYFHFTREQRNWDIFFRNTTLRQAQSIAELVRVAHIEDIAELKARANSVNARVIQNENIIAENFRYSGTIPDIAIENMSSDVFVEFRLALRDYQDTVRFSEQFYINDDRYSVFPRSISIFDAGLSEESSTQTGEGRNSHIARVLADSSIVDVLDDQQLWLGLYLRGSDEAVAYDRVFAGNTISGSLISSDTEFFSAAPIYSRDGLEVFAVIALEYDITDAMLSLQQSRRNGLLYFVGVAVVYAVLVLLVTRFLFSPLRRLLYSAIRIRQNDFDSRVFLKSRDELGLIGSCLDTTIEKLDRMVYEMKTAASIQSGLFPPVYLDFLDKANVGELEVGEYVDRYVTILSIRISCPEILEHDFFSSSSADIIELINDVVRYVSSMLDNNSGFIDQFTPEEMLLFFTHNPDMAMEMAMNLQYNLAHLNEDRESNGKPQVHLNMALHRGTVSFGIFGKDAFVKPYAVSDSINTTRKLSGLAKQTGSRIMVTDVMSRGLVKSLNYQFRYLGSMLLGMKKSLQVMEEIDVYPDHLRRVIAATKIDFEEGVKNFERRSLREAHAIFNTLADRIPNDTVIKSFREHIEQQYIAKD